MVDRDPAELTQRLSANGVELAWDQWGEGDGPPLVLCHGFTGSAIDFSLVIPALAERRRVVALDLRGHGRSTAVGALEGYGIELLAEDLVALLAEVGGGKPVDLLGHSMGGVVSILAVSQRPELVRSLILMDTSGWSFLFPDEALRAPVEKFMNKFDPARGMPGRPKWKSPEDELIEASTPEPWRARRDELYFGGDPYAYKALGSLLAFEGRVDLRPQLGAITCPVTVLVGEKDRPFVDHADELAATVAHGRVTVIAGAYHSPQLTHPDQWLGGIEAHLAAAHG